MSFIQHAHFRAPNAENVIRTPTGYKAFIPANLPPALANDNQPVLSLSQADAPLSELSGLGRHLPNPHLLIAPYVRREAVLSSRIEGTRASLSDLLINEMEEPTQGRGDQDVQEVRNYVSAMEYGLERLPKLPLSLRLLREIHKRLMKGVRGDRATPGEFRRSQNWIGPVGSTIETARMFLRHQNVWTTCRETENNFLTNKIPFPIPSSAPSCTSSLKPFTRFLTGTVDWKDS